MGIIMELMQRFNAEIIEDEMQKYVDEMLKHPRCRTGVSATAA